MQKWEHCAVVGMRVDAEKLDPRYPAIWYFNPEGLKVVSLSKSGTEKGGPPFQLKKEANEVSKAIARLGMEGWEMVGCGTTAQVTHTLYFKRPIT